MVMLYFSGNSYKDLEYGFRVANNTISLLVPDTCEAILDAYCDEFLRLLETPQEWLAVAEATLELAELSGCARWQTHPCPLSSTFWKRLLQLQGIFLNSFVCPCRL